MICTPANGVPALIAELGANGTRGAVVVTAGFCDAGNGAGRALKFLSAARGASVAQVSRLKRYDARLH